MTTQQTLIGLDIAKNVFQAHAVDETGRCVFKRKLGRSEVASFFDALLPCRVVLEACATSHYWARIIRQHGHEVALVPPEAAKAFVRKGKKNDAIDAAAICAAALHPDTRYVPVKAEEQQSILSLHSARALLIKQQTMVVNALRALAAEFGIVAPRGTGKLDALMATIATAELPETMKQVAETLFQQFSTLRDKVSSLEARIEAHARTDEDARRLTSVPGIGPVTASMIVASVTDIGAFGSARQFAAWLGLVPRQHSTGGKPRLGRITKAGNREIRTLLVLGATSMIYRAPRWQSVAGAWLRGLLERRPARLATIALANKTARIVWALLSRKEVYSPRGRHAVPA